MIGRIISVSEARSFFLFGARGTGKTSLLRQLFQSNHLIWIDFLDPDMVDQYAQRPSILKEQVDALNQLEGWIVLDEVQKVPRLLDVVHLIIESSNYFFALSGSSARKLKRGGANLLAGRAFTNYLFPLSSFELGEAFDLHQALHWGTLPEIHSLPNPDYKKDYLRTYAQTYLREEIIEEQVVRKLDPFRKFLGVAAQMSGFILNFSKIAREVGTSVPTIQQYFQILQDTYIGFFVEAHHISIRRQQRSNPKFYLFDPGVQRALQRSLNIPLQERTYSYGLAFENFVINEMYRLNHYNKCDFALRYLSTKEGIEIDIVLDRPGLKTALIEIKSTTNIKDEDIKSLRLLGPDFPNSTLFCFSQDPKIRKIDNVLCLPWQKGLIEVGLI